MSENVEEQLLVLCTYHPLSDEEKRRAVTLAAEVRDWQTFADLAKLNYVQPMVLRGLASAGVQPPDAVRAPLQEAAEKVRQTNEARLRNAKIVLAKIAEARIPLCVLKGMLFSETIYHDPFYKRMNDVDMLVHRDDVPRLEEIYASLDYFFLGERVGDKPKTQKKISHHLPPYVSRDLQCLLGTQWGLKSPLVGLKIDYDRIWRRVRPLSFHGIALQQMAPIDNLFHVCIHLGFFKTGVRDVMDIYNLARHAGTDIDYTVFTSEVREAGAEDLVFHSLSLAHAMCPLPAFAQVLAALQPHVSPFMQRAVAKKTASLSTLVRLCSGHLSSIEKAISEFNASQSASEKARYYAETWKHILVPPYDDARRIAFAPQATGLAGVATRVSAPVHIVRAIAAEIGGLLLAALMAKGTFDIAKALVDPRSWMKSRHRDLEAFAAAHGVTLADLQKVKDGIF